MYCTIYVAKSTVLICCAVTAQLICAFVFTYAKKGFLMMWLIQSRWRLTEVLIKLCGCAEADLQLCCLHILKSRFSHNAAQFIPFHSIYMEPHPVSYHLIKIHSEILSFIRSNVHKCYSRTCIHLLYVMVVLRLPKIYKGFYVQVESSKPFTCRIL